MVNHKTQAVSRSKRSAKVTPANKKEAPPLRKSGSSDSTSCASKASKDVSCASGTRRLSDEEVRAVFECLINNGPIPDALPFTIVPVGSEGMKLSPPSYKFPVGLYILLKPLKRVTKKKSNVVKDCSPVVPNHLKHLMAKADAFDRIDSWSLSGPQFPDPTSIQQRYCYPKSKKSEYASMTGGALWTMKDRDQNELLDYRLLHVYYSVKRASNKGLSVPSHVPKSPKILKSPKIVNNKRPRPSLEVSPAVTHSSVSHASLSSPDYFDAAPSYSGYRYNYPPAHYPPQYYHPHHSRHPSQLPPGHVAHPSTSSSGIFRQYHSPASHVFTGAHRHSSLSSTSPKSTSTSYKRPKLFSTEDIVTSDPDQTLPQPNDTKSHDSFDLKSLSFTHSYGDSEVPSGVASVLATDDLDSFWKEPLLALEMNDTNEAESQHELGVAVFMDGETGPSEGRLEYFQKNIRELILQAPTKEQKKALVAQISTWATGLDKDDFLDAPFASRQDSKPPAVPTSSRVKTEEESIIEDAIKTEEV